MCVSFSPDHCEFDGLETISYPKPARFRAAVAKRPPLWYTESPSFGVIVRIASNFNNSY